MATEVAASLLMGTFPLWDSSRQPGFGNQITPERKEGIRRFSSSLRHYRITKIVAGMFDGDWYVDPSYIERVIHCHLGNDSDPSCVVVSIRLVQSELSNVRWGKWVFPNAKAVVCITHPDPKFVGFVIFGDEGDEED